MGVAVLEVIAVPTVWFLDGLDCFLPQPYEVRLDEICPMRMCIFIVSWAPRPYNGRIHRQVDVVGHGSDGKTVCVNLPRWMLALGWGIASVFTSRTQIRKNKIS